MLKTKIINKYGENSFSAKKINEIIQISSLTNIIFSSDHYYGNIEDPTLCIENFFSRKSIRLLTKDDLIKDGKGKTKIESLKLWNEIIIPELSEIFPNVKTLSISNNPYISKNINPSLSLVVRKFLLIKIL